ncbi:unnamed protein product, partial [Ectocarpus sp. 12 AP-2014]
KSQLLFRKPVTLPRSVCAAISWHSTRRFAVRRRTTSKHAGDTQQGQLQQQQHPRVGHSGNRAKAQEQREPEQREMERDRAASGQRGRSRFRGGCHLKRVQEPSLHRRGSRGHAKWRCGRKKRGGWGARLRQPGRRRVGSPGWPG